MPDGFDHDFIIVGSGFGGSASALRLCEKGYDVLMLEKGSELGPAEFPKSNWNLKRWLWMPWLGFRGLFRMTFFRHVTILTGVGVGGGLLVYACTHPVPGRAFFTSPAWSHLGDWETELAPHYAVAKRMLGVSATPFLTKPDKVLREIATRRGQPDEFHATDVAVYFGDAGVEVDDPYFGGEGPKRTGCIRCGGCMLGCQHGAKNTLDKNYLWLARKLGLKLQADTEVTAVRALPDGGYRVECKVGRHPLWRRRRVFTAEQIVFAGGVLGTLDLLTRMKKDEQGLPKLSDRLGSCVRTNSEALIGVVAPQTTEDLSKGIAIGSIYQTDAVSHIEPVRYPAGSGFFRTMMAPHVGGRTMVERMAKLIGTVFRHPGQLLRAVFVSDFSRKTAILLYMRASEGTLRLRRSLFGLGTQREAGDAPTASIPEATELAGEIAKELGGMPMSLMTETLLNIPTTAHILGGCTMGESAETGVIDRDHRVFGYEGMYVVDGSSISANPGVNPSLTILALAERAMSKIPVKAGKEVRPALPERARPAAQPAAQ